MIVSWTQQGVHCIWKMFLYLKLFWLSISKIQWRFVKKKNRQWHFFVFLIFLILCFRICCISSWSFIFQYLLFLLYIPSFPGGNPQNFRKSPEKFPGPWFSGRWFCVNGRHVKQHVLCPTLENKTHYFTSDKLVK